MEWGVRKNPLFVTRKAAQEAGFSSIKALNEEGKASGFGGCLICGDSWFWKENHVIFYLPTSGAFPTCEECFKTRSIEEIEKAIDLLVEEWRPHMGSLAKPMELEPLRLILKEEARRTKQEGNKASQCIFIHEENGNDKNADGTVDHPYKTREAALAAAQPGNPIIFGPGVGTPTCRRCQRCIQTPGMGQGGICKRPSGKIARVNPDAKDIWCMGDDYLPIS